MNKSPKKSPKGGSESGVKKADTTSTSGGIETDHQRGSDTASGAAADSPEPTDRQGLPLDQTFELLRNQRRRYVLQYLEAATGQVSLSEVAEQIAAWENDKEVRQITSSERKRVYVGLYQCHLPKMDSMGVISFNKPRGVIERGKHADAVEPYLQRAAVSERSSVTGPKVGSAVLVLTVLPAAILQGSQVMLALAVAMTIVVAATLGGVSMLRRSNGDGDVVPDETRVA